METQTGQWAHSYRWTRLGIVLSRRKRSEFRVKMKLHFPLCTRVRRWLRDIQLCHVMEVNKLTCHLRAEPRRVIYCVPSKASLLTIIALCGRPPIKERHNSRSAYSFLKEAQMASHCDLWFVRVTESRCNTAKLVVMTHRTNYSQ